MKWSLSRWSDPSLVCLRIVFGLLFATHGAQKLFGFLHGHQFPIFSQLWVGGIIELATGIAIALGVLFPCAPLLASGTMAVAYVQFHWKLQLGENFFPVVNKGELAVLYCFAFLYLGLRGPGPFALGVRGRR